MAGITEEAHRAKKTSTDISVSHNSDWIIKENLLQRNHLENSKVALYLDSFYKTLAFD